MVEGIVTAMADKKDPTRMKSAYELALERLERQGIEPPRESALSDQALEQVAEVRRVASARLAELEILHRNRMRTVADPVKRGEDEAEYVRERHRIEAERDRKIAAARQTSS
jgi:hypothetical protein